MLLRYGEKSISCEISAKNLLGILKTEDFPAEPLDIVLKRNIMNPIGKPRLKDLLRKNKPRDIIIIVSDVTRSIARYDQILEFLVGEIIDAGIDEKNIEFLIALGTHREHTADENKMLYGNLVSAFSFTSHDCHNNLVSIGTTRTGLEVQVNKRAREAEFVIITGRINFHYLAGFSGGRKSILPGVSSYETIQKNHCKLKRNGVASGIMIDNIIAQEMEEAANLFCSDYILNVVETSGGDTAQAFCGDPVLAFKQGVQYLWSKQSLKISQKADCAIISAGGYPKDSTFFMGHKAINNAVHAVKDGGAIILAVQSSEGIGNERFQEYMVNNTVDGLLGFPENRIELGGHRAFVTAKVLKNQKVYVLSDLNPKTVSQMNFIPVRDLDEGLNMVRKDYGQEFKAYIFPDGKSILPVVDAGHKK